MLAEAFSKSALVRSASTLFLCPRTSAGASVSTIGEYFYTAIGPDGRASAGDLCTPDSPGSGSDDCVASTLRPSCIIEIAVNQALIELVKTNAEHIRPEPRRSCKLRMPPLEVARLLLHTSQPRPPEEDVGDLVLGIPEHRLAPVNDRCYAAIVRQDIVGAEIRVHEVPDFGAVLGPKHQLIESLRDGRTDGVVHHSLPVIHMGISNRAYEITPCSVLTDSLRSEWAEPARLAKIGRSDRIHGLRDRLQNSGQFGFRQVLQRDTLCTAGDAIGQALAEFPNVKHFRNRERGRCKVPINITIFVETIGAAIYPQDISTPSYIEAESTRFFALLELHQVGDAVELFDQKLLDRRRGEFRLFHISLPPDERLLRHSPSAVPIGSAVQMRDFR